MSGLIGKIKEKMKNGRKLSSGNEDAETDIRQLIAEERKKLIKCRRENAIALTSLRTGQPEDAVREKIRAAKEDLGITFPEYAEHQYAFLPEEVWPLLHERVRVKQQQETRKARRECLKNIRESRGCENEEAKAALADAKEKWGITARQYAAGRFYEIPEKDHGKEYLKLLEAELAEEKKSLQEKSAEDTYDQMKDFTKRFGLTEEEYLKERYYLLTAEELERLFSNMALHADVVICAGHYDAPEGDVYARALDIKKQYGLPVRTFADRDLYKETDPEVFRSIRKDLRTERNGKLDRMGIITGWGREKAEEYVKDMRKRYGVTLNFVRDEELFKKTDDQIQAIIKEKEEDTSARRKKIREATGWSEFELEKHRAECRYRYSINELYKYDNLDCWKLPWEVLDTFAMPKDRIRLGKAYNDRECIGILGDKTRFDEVFSEFLGRRFWVNRETDLEEFEKFAEGQEEVFCKPINLLGGHGCFKQKLTGTPEEMYEFFMGKNKMLIEEIPRQHPAMNEIYDKCIDTIRVTTLLADDEFIPFACWVKFGGRGSIVDGRVDGGCFAAVDEKTGKVVTGGLDKDGVHHTHHYDTGKPILGFTIPCWDQILDLTERALRHVEGLNFVGWDVAVTENGPIIIEGNSRPAVCDYQLLFGETHEGKRFQFEKYLPE